MLSTGKDGFVNAAIEDQFETGIPASHQLIDYGFITLLW
jgi:hypothetical protein